MRRTWWIARGIAVLGTLTAVIVAISQPWSDDAPKASVQVAKASPTRKAAEVTSGPMARLAPVRMIGGNMLLLSNRSMLSICVSGVSPLIETTEHVARVRSALEENIGRTAAVPPGYKNRQVVAHDCPAPTGLTSDSLRRFNKSEGRVYCYECVRGYSDTERIPSEHLVLVYFLPRDRYWALFLDAPYVTTIEETLCEGDVCNAGITRGLYLVEDVSPANLDAGLREVLNLDPAPRASLLSDWVASVCKEIPEPWCENYANQ